MKKKLTLIALSFVSIFSAMAAVVSTLAWFASGTKIAFGDDPDNVNVTGGTAAEYYESGSGTANDKYVISNKTHLYNLAWLQYIGYYNAHRSFMDTPSGDDILQCYFKLKNDIDMEGMTLPPIGTEKYPFLGNFDGQGFTVSNFTVSNDNPTLDSSDFGVAKPSNPRQGVPSDVIGFFGVVGKLPNATISFDTSVVSIANVTLKDFTIKARTTNLLIGLAGGYVDGAMSGVKIDGDAKLDLGTTNRVAKSDITSNLTDYGLVGYTTKTASSGTFSQELSEYYDNGVGGSGGTGNDFGDSINMLSLYNRLSKVYNEDSYDSGSFTVDVSSYPDGTSSKQKHENINNNYSGYYAKDYSYTFNKQYEGSQDIYFLYGDYSPVSGTITNNNYTYGSKTVSGTQLKIKQSGSDTYYFYSGNYYLKVPAMSSTSMITLGTSDKTTDASQATQFYRTQASGNYVFYITETYNNRLYYRALNGNNTGGIRVGATTTLLTSSGYQWSLTGSSYKSVSKNTYYLAYANNKFTLNTTSSNAASCGTNQGSDYYLAADFNNNQCTSLTNTSNATIWFHSNNKIFTLHNDVIYYLISTSTSTLGVEPKTTENDATSWTYSSNHISCVIDTTTYYIKIAPTPGLQTSQGDNVTEESQGSNTFDNQSYLSSTSQTQTSIPYNSFKNTYIPVSVSASDIYTTSPRNVGYIVSGKTFENTSQPGYNSGDIRVARYEMNNINGSMGQDLYDDSKIYIVTATSNSNYALINDTHNKGGTGEASSIPEELSSISNRKAATDLYRYNAWEDSNSISHNGARESLKGVFDSNSTQIYGLHFMNATISTSNTMTIPNAVVNGKTYTSGLQVPKDCIDFFVKKEGYITFFAGTYFSGNSCFFSLNKIDRDSNNAITAITPISTIYKDGDGEYYYNPSDTSGKTLVFDTAVLTNPTTFINKALYYFEIPVGGNTEFALGSVSGKAGAYLMYLDISASGEAIDAINAHYITTFKTGNTYPVGVDFAPVAINGSGGESIGVYIASGKQGTITFTMQTSNIAISQPVASSVPLSTYSFQGTKYSSSSPPSGNFTVSGNSPGNLAGPPDGGTKVLTINVVSVGGDSHVVTITDYYDVDDGNGGFDYDPNSSTYQIDNESPVVGISTAVKNLSSEINSDAKINALRNLNVAATLTRQSGSLNDFVVTYNNSGCSYEDKIVDVNIDANGTSIGISVTTGYTFKIGGTAYANNSTYPSS